jgi:hypothetical protein
MAFHLQAKRACLTTLAIGLVALDVAAAGAAPFELSEVELDTVLAGATAVGASEARAVGTASYTAAVANTVAASLPAGSATGVAVGAAAGAASNSGPVLATAAVSYSHGDGLSNFKYRTSTSYRLAAVVVAKVSAQVRIY